MNMKVRSASVIFAVLIATISGCTSEEATEALRTVDMFPVTIENTGLNRSDEVRLFVGDSLYEYINGGAEVYHDYGFEEVATADYKSEDVEITADIYAFADADGAFGLYSIFRPDETTPVEYGVEGFVGESSVDFVKGRYLVRLIGYDATPALSSAIDELALTLNTLIQGEAELPESFTSFPADHGIARSEKYHAVAFMGHGFLTSVYSKDYMLDGDTTRLFLTDDGNGYKFQQWSGVAEPDSVPTTSLTEIPFDNNQSLVTGSFYGTVVVGSKRGLLLGVTGYKESHTSFLKSWIEQVSREE